MAETTGVVLATGAITAANQLLFAPLAGAGGTPWKNFNWRIIPATAGLALALAGLEHLAPTFAGGLAWLTLVAALILPVGGSGQTVIQNLTVFMGYAKKGS